METETPLIAETIALAEKKVAMALDDIIKLSKRKANVNKGKKSRRGRNKNRNSAGAAKNNSFNVQHYTNSLSAVRQGAVAKRGNQFSVTTHIARKAFNAGRMTSAHQSRLVSQSVQSRYGLGRLIVKRHELVDGKVENSGVKRKTLDSRFASMKEQRSACTNCGVKVHVPRLLPPWAKATRFPY